MRISRFAGLALVSVVGLVMATGCLEFGSSSDDSSDAMKWHALKQISGDANAFNAKIGIDESGGVLAAWYSGDHVWASSYVKGEDWSEPEKVDDAVTRISDFSVDMNGDGKAALMWRSEESSGDYFKLRKFDLSDGWEAEPQMLDALNSDGQHTDVDVAEDGEVFAVFARYASWHVLARFCDSEGLWDEGATRVDNGSYYSNYPKISSDGDGNAMAVWEQWDGVRTNARARYYSGVQGWKDTEFIHTLNAEDSDNVDQVFIRQNTDGAGVVFWTEADHSRLVARLFDVDVFQESPTTLDETTGSITGCFATVDAAGNVVIVWRKLENDDLNVYARKYTVGSGWDESAFLISEEDNAATVDSFTFASNADGDGVALWGRTGDNKTTLYARWYTSAKGWSSKSQIVKSTETGTGLQVTSAAVDSAGRAAALVSVTDVPGYNTSAVNVMFFY